MSAESATKRKRRRARLERELLLGEAVMFSHARSSALYERSIGRVENARMHARHARASWKRLQPFLVSGRVQS